MRLKHYLVCGCIILLSSPAFAKDYKAALFNIYGDGETLNTRSIQFAIDYVHDHGGGRLVFDVGRYLTGSISLKSDVTLHLKEGAVLLGDLNPLNYEKHNWTALIFALGQQNIAITGKGIINGQGQFVARNEIDLVGKGLLNDPLNYGRVEATSRPVLIYFNQCTAISIKGVTLKNSSSWTQVYSHCRNLRIDSISVDSKAYWNNDGIDVLDSRDVVISNSFIDADDDGICLKSFDKNSRCEDIIITNCTVRSSANGIKFGTASYGGFYNIRIINNKVYNTYRSAIALEAVYGGSLSKVLVDSLDVHNTGNLIFLRIGARNKEKPGQLRDIRFSHIVGEIAAKKPDQGYRYEGPVEDLPRNISPAIIIAGLPGADITDVSFDDITVSHPGGGNPYYASIPLDALDSIPEWADHYPDFSMFKELPAWAIFVRHAQNIRFLKMQLNCTSADFRVPVVLDDVRQTTFESVKIEQPNPVKDYYQYRSQGITIQ